MAENGGEPRQISVSRDALRADLAEMELRLTTWIGSQLEKKASAEALEAISKRLELQESGTITPAQELRFKNLMDTHFAAKLKNTWSLRASKAGALYILIAAVALSISILTLVHTWK